MVAKPIPPADVMVDEESLARIRDFPEPVQNAVAAVLEIVKYERSSEHFQPSKAIPDEAPEKVKMEMAYGSGRSFRIGINQKDGTYLAMSWYEPYDRRMVFFWDILWPATVVVDDEI